MGQLSDTLLQRDERIDNRRRKLIILHGGILTKSSTVRLDVAVIWYCYNYHNFFILLFVNHHHVRVGPVG